VSLLRSVLQVDTMTLHETFHEIVVHRSQSSPPGNDAEARLYTSATRVVAQPPHTQLYALMHGFLHSHKR
jgi:hypothetical protein